MRERLVYYTAANCFVESETPEFNFLNNISLPQLFWDWRDFEEYCKLNLVLGKEHPKQVLLIENYYSTSE